MGSITTYGTLARRARLIRVSSISLRLVSTMWSDVSGGSLRGALAASRCSIQGVNTNWMKANGSSTRMKRAPLTSTTTEKMRPASDRNVMSPNPSVDMVVNVQ